MLLARGTEGAKSDLDCEASQAKVSRRETRSAALHSTAQHRTLDARTLTADWQEETQRHGALHSSTRIGWPEIRGIWDWRRNWCKDKF